MRTVAKTYYSFSELSEEAKEQAIENYREQCNDYYFIWLDAENTVKSFLQKTDVQTGRNSWLEFSTSYISDGILDLKGLRLRTWIYNNWNFLFKRKYLKCIGDNKVINHPMVKTHYYDMKKGARVSSGNFCYSTIQKENSCVLTGMCYDDDFLKPIYDFLEYKNPNNQKYVTLEDLLEDCFSSLKKTIENEIEYKESNAGIQEEILSNGSEFDEEGNLV
jgi:hypothetical protein